MNLDEEVDILDEKGNILEVATKARAHTEGLLHKCVIGKVVDSHGRWLLVKQASDRQDAGQYVFPVGGHVSAGESEEDALIREAEEELGLQKGFTYEYLTGGIFDRHVIGRHEKHMFALYNILSDAEPVINHESESYRYFTEEEIQQEMQEHPKLFGDAFYFVMRIISK